MMERFNFQEAMEASGINPVFIDENTEFPSEEKEPKEEKKEPTEEDLLRKLQRGGEVKATDLAKSMGIEVINF